LQFLAFLQVVHNYYGIPENLVLLVGNASVVIFNVLVAAAYLSMAFSVVLMIGNIMGFSDIPGFVITISYAAGILMFVEFVLCNVPIIPFHATFMVTWACIYTIFSWIFYSITTS
jgi:hypothetical protein